MKTQDNYQNLREKWAALTTTLDHEELASRLPIRLDADYIYITFFSKDYRINRSNGHMELIAHPENELGFNELMTIYGLLYYAKPTAKIRGEFVPFRQVKRAAPFESAYIKTILKPFAATFSEQADKLEAACIALNGRKIPQGDVGYVINAFDCIPLTILFWDGDDEFEAQTNILFDADITDFLHEELVVSIAAELASKLAMEAGLSNDGLLGDEY